MGQPGGSVVQALREEVREAVLAYYMRLDDLKQGINVEAPAVPRPWALTLHEQMRAFAGALPDQGGLLDQPYLLMAMLSGVDEALYIRSLKPNLKGPANG